MCIISAALEKAGPVRLLSSTGVVKQVVLTSGPSRAMAEETKITAEMLQKKLLEVRPQHNIMPYRHPTHTVSSSPQNLVSNF